MRLSIRSKPKPIFCDLAGAPVPPAPSPRPSEMELPLTFKDSSRKVIIELLPAVCRQEIGKWHMGLGTKYVTRQEGRI